MRSQAEFLTDLLTRLNQAGLEYMLTGSMASNYWGIPRTTHDADVVLALEREQVDRVIEAFQSGFFIQPESVRSAFRPPSHFNVLDELSAMKADFWLLQNTPFEQTAFSRRVPVRLFDISAWIATPEDVILHKLYWNRLTPSDRQLEDAAGVYAVQGDRLDCAYIHHWAAYLNVQQEWEQIITGTRRPKDS